MKILGLPGDTFEIDLDTRIMTHPTVGPLFGNFKFQADVFTCPIRLYNAMLHNNTLNIGLDMSKVKLPVAGQWTKTGSLKYGLGSINEYFGVKGSPKNTNTNNGVGDYQIIPHLAYYDIFKNYYANKQEERFYVMGGSSIQNATTIESTDFTGKIANDVTNKTLICETESTVTITGTNLNLEDIKKVLFTIDNTQSIYIDVKFDEGGRNFWQKVSVREDEIILKTIKGRYYQ